jgi:hypothetical protein
LAATAIALNDVHSLGLTGRFDRVTAPVCPIAGVGPGKGSALAKHFSEGAYRVALLAKERGASCHSRKTAFKRQRISMRRVRSRSDRGGSFRCGARSRQSSVVIHSAVGGVFGAFREIDPYFKPPAIADEIWHLVHPGIAAPTGLNTSIGPRANRCIRIRRFPAMTFMFSLASR